MKHNRIRTLGLLIALFVLTIALAALVASIYRAILQQTTEITALFSLGALLFMIVLIVGATTGFLMLKLGYAYGREQALKDPPQQGMKVLPYEVKLFGLTLVHHPAESFLFSVKGESMHEMKFGRKSLYDDATIRTVIQKWEQRDMDKSNQTLADFLEQEFGVYEDGSPKISPVVFYGWRRRIVKNSEA